MRAFPAATWFGPCVLALIGAATSLAQISPAALDAPAETAIVLSDAPQEHVNLWPDLGRNTLTWFSIVVVLAVLIQTRPLQISRNLDAKLLAALGLLLALRGVSGTIAGDPAGLSVNAWSSLLLAALGLYWMFRGFWVLRAGEIPAIVGNVREGGLAVLVLAGVMIAALQIATAPTSDASRDGFIGGLYMAQTGKLPYATTTGHDGLSPLVYAAHAGALKLAPATHSSGNLNCSWENRDQWMIGQWWNAVDMTAVRLVNGIALALTLLGLLWTGQRLHSGGMGLAMVAVFCVLPGCFECFHRPDIMLATMLLTWGVAFTLAPGVGGLLSVLLLVLAGIAWPWAWLALPVALAYFLKHGWNGVGATFGMLIGVSACLFGLAFLVEPGVPRPAGALAAAGLQTTHVAALSETGALRYEAKAGQPASEPVLHASIWSFLLRGETLRPAPDGPLFREVAADGAASEKLVAAYRAAAAELPELERLPAALRTVLEQTWLAPRQPSDLAESAWSIWAGLHADAALWTNVRRGLKVACAILAALVALMLLRTARPKPFQLIGGLTTVLALALLTSQPGATNNWVWLTPLVLTLFGVSGFAVRSPKPIAGSAPRPGMPAPTVAARGAAPRITVNN